MMTDNQRAVHTVGLLVGLLLLPLAPILIAVMMAEAPVWAAVSAALLVGGPLSLLALSVAIRSATAIIADQVQADE